MGRIGWVCAALAVAAATARAGELKRGAEAPALTIAKWLSGEPVGELRQGRVYVVAFWAVWSEPAVAALPRLGALQAAHPDRLTAVAVTTRDDANTLTDVEAFVAARGNGFGCALAFDHDRVTYDRWMRAAGRRAVPCVFVVDGAGRIAWIGHPLWLDHVVAEVLAGTFGPDRLGLYR